MTQADSSNPNISEEEIKFKKLEIWLNFVKYILSVILTGIFATYINFQIQNKNLEIKEREQELTLQMKQKEQEQEYLRNFINLALDDKLEKRVRFAQYFSSLLEGKWINYYENIKSEYNNDLNKIIEKQEQLSRLTELDISENKAIIERLQLEISVIKAKLNPQINSHNADYETDSLTIKSEVYAKITSHTNGDRVANSEIIKGVCQNIPDNRYLWIVVRPKLFPNYHPQSNQSGSEPISKGCDGKWETTIFLGENSKKNKNEKFDVLLISLNDKGNEQMIEYLRQANKQHKWKGLNSLPNETEIFHKVLLIRK